MSLCDCHFFSSALNISTRIQVIIPEGEAPETGYPTLYLLHGYTDDCTAWTRLTAIERYARDYRLAVVMPDVQKSFYNDYPGMSRGYRYFTYITEELIAVTRRMFRLSERREDTYVAGLSMGGFGAFKCALNRPDVYAAAASLSGALDIARDLAGNAHANEVRMIFGSLDTIAGSVNDLQTAAGQAVLLPEHPRLYQYCGTEDFLYDTNKRFHSHLQALPYEHTYVETPGGHEWRLWDAQIKAFIDTLNLVPLSK